MEMAPKPLKYIFLAKEAIITASSLTPPMFRFSYQFQIVAGDLNRVIVQSRFTEDRTRSRILFRILLGLRCKSRIWICFRFETPKHDFPESNG